MDLTIGKTKSCTVECSNVDKKLRQLLDLTEDEAHFHLKQSAFLCHLGVQKMPKSHHWLSMRLTVEYFRAPPADIEQSHAHKLDNPSYPHYVIVSQNILALSVAINSTVMNAEETENIIFNLLTDDQNYYATKLWFRRNSYKEAVVHVLNLKDLKFNYPYDLDLKQLSPSEEFRISNHNNLQPSSAQKRTEYISIFGHLHFLLPEIFKNLKKVVVLDDDIVVQRDLSPLWNIDLQQKVIGAPQFCGVRLGQLKSYLDTSQSDNSCVWMCGLTVVDLERWRELDATGIYQKILRKMEKTNLVLRSNGTSKWLWLGKFSLEGRVEHKFDMEPHSENFGEYDKLSRERTKKAMIKTRQVQIIDNDHRVLMRPLPGMVGLVPFGSKVLPVAASVVQIFIVLLKKKLLE